MKIIIADDFDTDNIWKIIKWYCEWYFGRDDYNNKVIVFETKTSICCKWEWEDYLTTANFNSEEEKNEKIAEREKFERPKD